MEGIGFKAKLEARIAEINRKLRFATGSVRRTLQKERAELEAALQKVSA